MSKEGIKNFASVLSIMQESRGELLRMYENGGDKQDILLGQLLEDAKDAVKDKFMKIISEKKGK